MKSTHVLSLEHRLIEQMLIALDEVARRIGQGDDAPPFSEDLLDFFQLFADGTHHAKEERTLFPALARRGVGPDTVVDAMLHQHELGRTHVRDMRQALGRMRKGDVDARDDFATSASAYSELLRVHIQIEDDDVYPMAEGVLSEDDDRDLIAEFSRLDADTTARAARGRWDELLHRCRALSAA